VALATAGGSLRLLRGGERLKTMSVRMSALAPDVTCAPSQKTVRKNSREEKK
jgi:hypothetical protein